MLEALEPGKGLIVWTDSEDHLHATIRQPDPRISRSPLHIENAENSRFGRESGAWLITGPASASRVIIVMPANPALGLALERWEVDLTL